MTRSLEPLRKSYDTRRRKHQPMHAGQRVPLTDRRTRRHSTARFGATDASLLYAGPIVVCLEHRERDAPSTCWLRRRDTCRWPGAPIDYDVWRPQQQQPFLMPPPHVHDMLPTENGLLEHPLQYLDHERRELPLLGAVAGTPIEQLEIYDSDSATTVTMSNDAALAIQRKECGTRCTPCLYHRFGVVAPRLDANEWCVYVIESVSSHSSENGYIGIAPFVEHEQRLKEHNGLAAGGAQTTSVGRPWRSVRVCRGYATRLAAEQAEARAHGSLPNGGPRGPLVACLAALATLECK